jgi:hypothetical protein
MSDQPRGAALNPFSEGGFFDGHTIGDTVYLFLHPNEVQSGQSKQLTKEEVEALSKSTPNYVPLDDFHPGQALQQGLQRLQQALSPPTISTSTKVVLVLVSVAIIVLVLKR